MGSNRTFMELKFAGWGSSLVGDACSNRTFMELKFDYAHSKGKKVIAF